MFFKDFKVLDIYKIDIISFYRYIRSDNYWLFILIITKEEISLSSHNKRGPRIKRNETYFYDFKKKHKYYYKFGLVKIFDAEVLTIDDIKEKILKEYYNYLNVFDRSETKKLSSYKEYNYKLKFIDNNSKSKLSKSRIYLIFAHKLEEVKKYLNENLRKRFITLNKTSFISLILFTKKSNNKLRFYVDYRRLNSIIKRNCYSILLIDEILIRI